MSKAFNHRNLLPWEFRLVELLPGQDEDEISCKIKVASINDAGRLFPASEQIEDGDTPQYVALSYVWGDPKDTTGIVLDGQTFQVTKNLWAALHQLLQPQSPRVFWIDAICINQRDIAERNRLVRRMKEFYENAEQVIVWLGPASDDSDYAIDKVRSICLYHKERYYEEGISDVITQCYMIGDICNEGPPCRTFNPRLSIALKSLFERPWWSRIWVVQEATTSTNTILTCGSRWVDWGDLLEADLAIGKLVTKRERGELPEMPIMVTLNIRKFEYFRKNRCRESAPTLELIKVLSGLRGFESTDARDKVIAALGLTSNMNAVRHLRADYDKSIRETYTDVVEYMVSTTAYGHQLDILGYCFENIDDGEHLPSWVPDWRTEIDVWPFPKEITSTRKAYCASGTDFEAVAQYNNYQKFLTIAGNILYAKGFPIDSIESTKAESNHDGDKLWDTLIEESWMPDNAQDGYFTGESLYDACLRTIAADVKYSFDRPIARGYAISWLGIAKPQGPFISESDPFLSLMHACFGRRFATTQSGFIGLVPRSAQPGDLIYLLLGGQVLYVLRQVEEHFLFIGECYIHGMMDGEALDMLKNGLSSLQIVEIW